MEKARRDLTQAGGTYVLFLRLQTPKRLTVGKLGRFSFPHGVYAYAGSALGPGGLSARLSRHLRHPKPLHWHIDYLRAYADPYIIWLLKGETSRECTWADALRQMDEASQPAPGFGSSDCCCLSHLVHFPTPPAQEVFEQTTGDTVSITAFAE